MEADGLPSSRCHAANFQLFVEAGRNLKWTSRARSDHGDLPSGSSGSEFGGARRDRTDDLLLAKQALSQLSYGPGRA